MIQSLPHAAALGGLFTDPASQLATEYSEGDRRSATVFTYGDCEVFEAVVYRDGAYHLDHSDRGNVTRSVFVASHPEDIERYLLISNLWFIMHHDRRTENPWHLDPYYSPREGVTRSYDDLNRSWTVTTGDRTMWFADAFDVYGAVTALIECAGVPVDDLITLLSGPHPERAREVTRPAVQRPWTLEELTDDLVSVGRSIFYPVRTAKNGDLLFQWTPLPGVHHKLPAHRLQYTYRVRLDGRRRRFIQVGSATVGFQDDAQKERLLFHPDHMIGVVLGHVAHSGWTPYAPPLQRALVTLIARHNRKKEDRS